MGAKLSEAQERLLKRLADGQQKIHYGYPPRKFLIENGEQILLTHKESPK